MAGAVGQVQIEQDQIRPFGLREVEAGLGPRGRHEPHLGPPRQRALDQLDVHGVVLDVQHGQTCRSRHAGRRRRLLLGLELGDERADRRELLPRPACQRLAAAVRRLVAEEQLEAVGVRGERLEAQRSRGTPQTVRLERRCLACRCPRRGISCSFELPEPKLDRREPSRGIEHEDGEQLTEVGLLQEGQRIPSSCAAVAASARRVTPSFS